MSVLIKDMGKPKSCYTVIDGEFEYCPFVNTDDDCVLLLKKGICEGTWKEQYSKCPLIETPEPCEDAISRADAIRVASGYCHPANVAQELAKLPSVQPEPHYTDDQIQKMQDLEQAQLNKAFELGRKNAEWIPCSERLPEKHGWYLCTLKDTRVDAYYWNNKGEWLDNGKKHFFELYNISSRYTGENITAEQEGSVYWTDMVIAWMPLPEPYREDGDE